MFSGAGFVGEASQVFEIGLPAAYGPKGAAVTMLLPQSLETMSKEEITNILSSGVYMDAPTLDALNRLGFQELTGLAVEQTLSVDCIEELTDHPLNGAFAGRQRDCRQSFNHFPGYAFKKTNRRPSHCRALSIMRAWKRRTRPWLCSKTAGGRVCVSGYFPWTFLHSLSKASEMKSVMRWLSRDRLPAYVASYHKVNLWARQPSEGAFGDRVGQFQL